MRHLILLWVLLSGAHQSILAAPLPAEMQDYRSRPVAVSNSGNAVAMQWWEANDFNGPSLKLWRRLGGKWQVKTLVREFFHYTNAAFSPNGKYLATMEGSTRPNMEGSTGPNMVASHLHIREVATGKLWRESTYGSFGLLIWSRDSRRIAMEISGSGNGHDYDSKPTKPDDTRLYHAVAMFDLTNPPQQRWLQPQLATAWSSRIASYSWAPDGKSIAVGYGYGRAEIWTRRKNLQVRPRPGSSKDKTSADSVIRLTFERRLKLEAPSGEIAVVAWSNNGKILATLSAMQEAGPVRLWNAQTGKLLSSFLLRDRSDPIRYESRAQFSPDGTLMAWQNNHNVEVRRVRDGRWLKMFKAPRDGYWFALLGWTNNRVVRAWAWASPGGMQILRVR